ncbi:MAG: cell division protein FtsL [Stellaceae bacterium]
MIRLSTILWTLAVVIAGYAMFQVKFHVAKLDDEFARLNRQIAATREETRVLDAEWTLLDDPQRLDRLNGAFLKLQLVAPAQIVPQAQLSQIPLRNVPATAAVTTPPQVASMGALR